MIKREIYPKLRNHLKEKEITLITGPRQCGKTTLINMLIAELQSQDQKCLYLNLDLERDLQLLKSQEDFTYYLKLNLGTANQSFVFIDEVQRKEDAGIFLKGIYDQNLPYKFVISGSGSVELKEKIAEGLAGRKKTFTIRTVSLKEFINYKTNYQYQDSFEDYLISPFLPKNLLSEYLEFGGYPKLITTETREGKRDTLLGIYESYVTKDLKELLNLQRPDIIENLLAFLSTRIGKITAISDISNGIGANYSTVKQYLYYLEKTFQIEVAQPYSTNPESELTKSANYYFADLGMRNFIFNRLSHYDPIVSGPMLFQNLVYLALAENNLISKINYWRTKDGEEMDLIARIGAIAIPIEVKFQSLSSPKISSSMHAFISKYSPQKMFVVNKDLSSKVLVDSTQIYFVPIYFLLTKDFTDLLVAE